MGAALCLGSLLLFVLTDTTDTEAQNAVFGDALVLMGAVLYAACNVTQEKLLREPLTPLFNDNPPVLLPSISSAGRDCRHHTPKHKLQCLETVSLSLVQSCMPSTMSPEKSSYVRPSCNSATVRLARAHVLQCVCRLMHQNQGLKMLLACDIFHAKSCANGTLPHRAKMEYSWDACKNTE